MQRAVHVIVTGRVQGVGFRLWTEDEALSLGLDGWVRNRRDGSVEAVFGGSDAAVEAMLAVLRTGPRGAVVTEVAAQRHEEEVGAGFEVRPTA